MSKIAERLKEIRKGSGLSQTEFAKTIGITQDSISLWESGKRIPGTEYIIQICLKYDVSSDYLLGIKDTF